MTGIGVSVHYLTGEARGLRVVESKTSPLRVHAAQWKDFTALMGAGLPPVAGVYLLTRPAPSGAPFLGVRPGEASDVRRRLQEHALDPKKADYSDVYVLSTVDDRMGKSDVRYLEARLHELVIESQSSQLEVDRIPSPAALNGPERDSLESWLAHGRLLLYAAGCRALDPGGLPLSLCAGQDQDDGTIAIGSTVVPDGDDEFELTYCGIWARGFEHSRGFVIRAGSDIRRRESAALLSPMSTRRRWLAERGILGEIPGVIDRWRLLADVSLPSSLIAAKTVCGAHVSNRGIWRRVAARSRLLVGP
jgi:hypothetical protein